jgi:hypothetical protein
MTLSQLKLAAGVFVACGVGVIGGLWAADGGTPPNSTPEKPAEKAKRNADPTDGPPFRFQYQALDATDLAGVTGLNIYKFRLDIPSDQRFDVVFRELADKDASPVEIHRMPFQRGKGQGPITVLVHFLKRDRQLAGVLLSQDKDAEYGVSFLVLQL